MFVMGGTDNRYTFEQIQWNSFEKVVCVHKYYSMQNMAVIWICVAFSFLQLMEQWIGVVTRLQSW